MLRKVLIANRGEIARRVMRTCRELGVATVAVFSDADADAPHVRDADEAVRLGPPEPGQSYLAIDRILEAARQTGADAIHPGYGFLSENADFAQAVTAAGLTWIGPAPDTIRLMGDKAAAKRHLEEAGVPTVPGIHAEGLTDPDLIVAADEIGFPVLVKAVAGGGGKGMRAVHARDELGEALEAARREARNAFGDDRLLLEKLVAEPRHIEIQVFGDGHGNVVHLFERECSVQRRHQKVVEEAPSPVLSPELRAEMGLAAVTAAKAVDYVGAGTVEFLYDDTSDPANPAFYFLEMNTRLQVEHPVTELTTGHDLVAWQLRVAAGEPLPVTQADLQQSGHAIEVRLYAEDPAGGFLPQTGPVLRFDTPTAPHVRVDTGVETGSEVSRFYDPMLAKLIVDGETREECIERMLGLLVETTVLGVTTNLAYLHTIIDHPEYRAGNATTHFIDEHLADWAPQPVAVDALVATAAALASRETREAGQPTGDPSSPWTLLGPWRTGRVGGWHVQLADGDEVHDLWVRQRAGGYVVRHADTDHAVDVDVLAPGHARVTVDGELDDFRLAIDGDIVWSRFGRSSCRLLRVPATRHADASALAGHAVFTAPMPGAVVAVNVAAGDGVNTGQTMVVVEAMKMEHPIKAPADGVVTAVHVAVGDAVDGDTILVEFDPVEAES